jgi:sensor histidine kinase regulating citrate/malate metabolism
METTIYQSINKELIQTLSFQKNLELDQVEDIKQRLERATLLGNIHHSKVTIFFHDDEGPKKVETTIWATGTNFVCLKGGIWIPISRITDIQYNY